MTCSKKEYESPESGLFAFSPSSILTASPLGVALVVFGNEGKAGIIEDVINEGDF